ncbi:hypothetical protein ACTWQL_15230 [Pseudalkalibacillus sp. R45]|uniref:hypothetical protein n=1 Tax=Pseudalkalibacillus sp. R45 TaxID=3457433 RepID=UPI003FCCF7D3
MFDIERLRSAIIFLGICVLLGSCTNANSNSNNTSYVPDYSSDDSALWEIKMELEELIRNMNMLTNKLGEKSE